MVGMLELWMPVLLAAVLVFFASFVIHMVLPIHRADYRQLPAEGKVMEAMRAAGVAPGNYFFPHHKTPKEMGSPEMIERYRRGPVGFVNVLPSGAPAMGRSLVLWFLFCLVVGVVVAYLAGRTLGPGTEYLQVFRVSGTVAFLAYAGAQPLDSIWKGQRWSTSLKHVVDGLVYALLTAGCFAWLWPEA